MPTLHLYSYNATLEAEVTPLLEASSFTLQRVQQPQSEGVCQPGDLVVLIADGCDEATFEMLSSWLEQEENAEWILISDGRPDICLDRLMSRGISYHFRTPLDSRHVAEVLDELYTEAQAQLENPAPVPVTSTLDQFGLLLGSSAPMRRLYRQLRRVSPTAANVLLVGESGSGKELAARTIHQQSQRHDQPFVAVNCAALPAELVESELFGHRKGAFTGATSDHEGVFTQAGDGTLFLDEITEMPQALQSKLLRVLESGEFTPLGASKPQRTQVRVIAATNRSPRQAIDDGVLREDLYFRLAHVPLELPPLRKRGSDVLELARHFLSYRNQETGTEKCFSQEAEAWINQHEWPGNVRELKHSVERAHILADTIISVSELNPPDFGSDESSSAITAGMSLREAERTLIMDTLEMCDQNKTQAARQLGISVKTLYNKLERFEIAAGD